MNTSTCSLKRQALPERVPAEVVPFTLPVQFLQALALRGQISLMGFMDQVEEEETAQ